MIEMGVYTLPRDFKLENRFQDMVDLFFIFLKWIFLSNDHKKWFIFLMK